MYSRTETVAAVLRFYREIICHPYLDDNALILPPPEGWGPINIEGKNETVHDLLRHLPYLRSGNQYRRLLVHWETVPICYLDEQNNQETYSIPAHCIYLTRSVDREGTSLILDTDEGTLTEYSHTGAHITVSHGEYEALPEAGKWKAHRQTPITELLDSWTQRYGKLVWMLVQNPIGQPTTGRFYSRADSRPEEEELVQQAQLEPWHPQDDSSWGGGGSELDRGQHEAGRRRRRHVSDIYNMYLRHGWPHHFDKGACKAELLELERSMDADERRLMDEANPDAALFD